MILQRSLFLIFVPVCTTQLIKKMHLCITLIAYVPNGHGILGLKLGKYCQGNGYRGVEKASRVQIPVNSLASTFALIPLGKGMNLSSLAMSFIIWQSGVSSLDLQSISQKDYSEFQAMKEQKRRKMSLSFLRNYRNSHRLRKIKCWNAMITYTLERHSI